MAAKSFNEISNPAEMFMGEAPTEKENASAEGERLLPQREMKSRRVQILIKPSTYAGIRKEAARRGITVNACFNELLEERIKTL